MTPIPAATYRLQFHRQFTFKDACSLVPYLADLGVSHVYASPIFKAYPGSTHGYDVCDHNELNPELGSRSDFEAFSAALQQQGLGLIADFVPNHMGVEGALNTWWRDVLEAGSSSPYAQFFDIDWQPFKREIENKVLLPVLGDHYGRMLEDKALRVAFDGGAFVLCYESLSLPLAPATTLPLLQLAVKDLASSAPPELSSIIAKIQSLPALNDTSSGLVRGGALTRSSLRQRLALLAAPGSDLEQAVRRVLAEWNDPASPAYYDRLDGLICLQAYRLCSWRVAGEEINYRRFFDVNTLAAIRMELPEVFDATHQLLLELIDQGHITGVRIDHVDGLASPSDYLHRLRQSSPRPFYLLVEKILGPAEQLPEDWPVEGTTGYEFASQLAQLQVHGPGMALLTADYEKFAGRSPFDYAQVAYRNKKLVMETSMASELNSLGHLLHRLAQSHWWYRDFTYRALKATIREVIACFPVYRTYIDPARPAPEADRRIINRALALARQRNKSMEGIIFEFLHDVLLPPEQSPHPMDEELRRCFVLKFQQCTGPVTAKGVEDTSFYVYHRLVALNEVGGDPASPGISIDTFHKLNAARLEASPHCMLATSTHDTKRSEDVRARLTGLSELADAWSADVALWHTVSRKLQREVDGRLAPDANEQYLLYQTLLGAWPLEGLNSGNRDDFTRRIQDYMVKALHEAKINSSWLEPNVMWDESVRDFIASLLESSRQNQFPHLIAPLAAHVARIGMVNSLAQTVLKLTSPGVPDIYQGTELWDFSLVDPDNRRPVDYALRKKHLASLAVVSPSQLLEQWRDGRVKMFAIQRLLALRREFPDLFSQGSCAPLFAEGHFAGHVVAFERKHRAHRMVVVVPIQSDKIGFPPVGTAWADTHIPASSTAAPMRDVFTGAIIHDDTWMLSEVLAALPFAVLRSE